MTRKRKGAARSLLASLPSSLRQSITAQSIQPLVQAELPQAGLHSTSADSDAASLPTSSYQGRARESDEYEEQAESSRAVKKARTNHTTSNKGKGKGKATNWPHSNHSWDCTGLVSRYTHKKEVPAELQKYFAQRHLLFSQYSSVNYLMDDTGWFSVTPEPIAVKIAERCRGDTVLDAFCGVGGNAIQFAMECERVIAMDNDPVRLRLARHNALHCGVADRIDFVLADFVDFAKSYGKRHATRTREDEIDVVFLSPPWGGPEYLTMGKQLDDELERSPYYPLSALLPIHGKDLFELAAKITPNIAYFLPRNVDLQEVADLAPMRASSGEGDNEAPTRELVEVEEEWVGHKLKAVTAYYGGLADLDQA